MLSMLPLAPVLLAFAYRARGGAVSLGSDTEARLLFWGVPNGFFWGDAAFNLGCDCWLFVGAACCLLAWAAACIGHSSEQTDEVEAHVEMASVTTLMLGVTLLPFFAFVPWSSLFVLAAFGPLGGVAYWLGYRCTGTLRLFGVTWCVPGDVSWGEFFTGFAFGLAVLAEGL